jgi:hypothetical protein
MRCKQAFQGALGGDQFKISLNSDLSVSETLARKGMKVDSFNFLYLSIPACCGVVSPQSGAQPQLHQAPGD